MPDREKVLNSIKACAHFPDHDCQSCDYCGDNFFCFNDQLIEDFETLMKEQEKTLYELGQLLKERSEEIERIKTPTAGDNHIPLRW